jgi:serine/threonine-protein kinase
MNRHNYQILNTIATGSTAVLYKAIQTSLDRKVVIKKLHAHLTSNSEFTKRFELEAKAAASLDHENIVRIIDSGNVDGNYFIIMEYIDGLSLQEFIERNDRIDEDIALLITHEICMGLDHAHQRGIIHRDIKPANIMITRDGIVKITDFGLAKLKDIQISQTTTNTLLGTPLYMSPEQAIGERIDGRSDIFSLGTICYEMLTGKQPFFGNNYAAVIENIISSTVNPPSKAADVSRTADSIVMKALSRQPGKRFRSAGEMANNIEASLGHDTILSSRRIVKNFAFGENKVTASETIKASTKNKKKKKMLPLTIAAIIIMGLTAIGLNPEIATKISSTAKRVISQNPTLPSGNQLAAGNNGIIGTQIKIFDAKPDTTATKMEKTDGVRTETFAKPTDTTKVHSDAPDSSTADRNEQNTAPEPIIEAKEVKAPVQKISTGYIDIHIKPEAAIFIDGKQRLFGSQLGPMSISAKRHTILIRRADYQDYSEIITIKKDELSKRRITLKKAMGKINFSTQEGVKILIAGNLMGITPLNSPIVIESGQHTIKLIKKGYLPWENKVEVQSNKTLLLKVSLIPR